MYQLYLLQFPNSSFHHVISYSSFQLVQKLSGTYECVFCGNFRKFQVPICIPRLILSNSFSDSAYLKYQW